MGQQTETIQGVFEAKPSGGGHLRSPKYNYAARGADLVVTPDFAKRFRLRGGEFIHGASNPQSKGRKQRNGLTEIETINGRTPDEWTDIVPFEDLTAIDPTERLHFEHPGAPMPMRIIDLMTPVGLGQRALIVAPPRTGKTVLLQQMADSISTNHPDAYMMVLLIDERPEEVTDMRRTVHGEVVASSNDHDIASHVRIAKLMITAAKRRLEAGQDVVILLDSLTRLGRAFNANMRGGGRIMSGGLDIRALTEPKTIFGAARNIENGGSLTIIASILVETGSRMDDVIFNEFKGTGNMEIMLSREMADLRLWPAIDLQQSGTRKEEKLLSEDELKASHAIRRLLINRSPVAAMESLMAQMEKHPSNSEFIKAMPTTARRLR
jgi:transcription termination factor Rho